MVVRITNWYYLLSDQNVLTGWRADCFFSNVCNGQMGTVEEWM